MKKLAFFPNLPQNVPYCSSSVKHQLDIHSMNAFSTPRHATLQQMLKRVKQTDKPV